LRMIADMLSISPETVRTHLSWINHELESPRWISLKVISDMKWQWVALCVHMLPLLRA
jgi:alkyl hydroperoxide reductase subunit AhpC